jgi:hypothetical protein
MRAPVRLTVSISLSRCARGRNFAILSNPSPHRATPAAANGVCSRVGTCVLVGSRAACDCPAGRIGAKCEIDVAAAGASMSVTLMDASSADADGNMPLAVPETPGKPPMSVKVPASLAGVTAIVDTRDAVDPSSSPPAGKVPANGVSITLTLLGPGNVPIHVLATPLVVVVGYPTDGT